MRWVKKARRMKSKNGGGVRLRLRTHSLSLSSLPVRYIYIYNNNEGIKSGSDNTNEGNKERERGAGAVNGKSCQKGGKKEGGRKEEREKEKGSAVFPRRPLVNYVFVEPIESHCGAVQKGYKRNVEAAIKAGRKASFYFAKSGE